MIFRIISLLVLIFSVIWIVRVLKQLNMNISESIKIYFDELKNWQKIFSRKTTSVRELKKVLAIVTLFLFDILFITGFFPVLFLGSHLTGFLLLLHVAISPVFAISFMILIVMSAESNKFNVKEFNYKNNVEISDSGISKIIFWILSVISIPVMLSIILGMYPLFGTEGQNNLLELHRYSVLLFTVLVFLQIGYILRVQKENQ